MPTDDNDDDDEEEEEEEMEVGEERKEGRKEGKIKWGFNAQSTTMAISTPKEEEEAMCAAFVM